MNLSQKILQGAVRPAFALVLALLVLSCSKDDEGIPNRLVIDGNVFNLAKGFIYNIGVFEDANNNRGALYQVFLTTSGINYTNDDFTGSGQAVYFLLFSKSTIELAAGTYSYNESFLKGFLLDGGAFDGNLSTGAGSEWGVTGGTVTISKSGATWVFQFTLTAEDDSSNAIEITGSFSGSLEEIES
jgi:hypothetical protein